MPAGYNIPISGSYGNAAQQLPVMFDPTYFDFQSPGAQEGAQGVGPISPNQTATSTASAAAGDGASAGSPNRGQSSNSPLFQPSLGNITESQILLYAALGLLALIAIVLIFKR